MNMAEWNSQGDWVSSSLLIFLRVPVSMFVCVISTQLIKYISRRWCRMLNVSLFCKLCSHFIWISGSMSIQALTRSDCSCIHAVAPLLLMESWLTCQSIYIMSWEQRWLNARENIQLIATSLRSDGDQGILSQGGKTLFIGIFLFGKEWVCSGLVSSD